MGKILYKTILSFVLFVGIVFSPLMAVAPGGVTDNLSIWLKIDDINSSHDTRVNKWEGIGGSWTSANGPTYKESGLNFHPKLHFSNETLIKNNKFDSTNMTFYSIQEVSGTQAFLKWDQILHNPYPYYSNPVTMYKDAWYGGESYLARSWGGTIQLDRKISSIRIVAGYKIQIFDEKYYKGYTLTYNSSQPSVGQFENKIRSYKISKYLFNPTYHSQSYNTSSVYSRKYIANISPYQTNSKINLTGDVYELIGFRGGHNENRISSYLGIKYGISQNQDYLNSSSTVFWKEDINYNTNTFGLGRDDISALHQRVSVSSSFPNLIISTSDDFTSLNNLSSRSNLQNNQYLMLSDNNQAISSFESDIFMGDMPFEKSTNRIWKVQNTNRVAEVFMQFKDFGEEWVLVASKDRWFRDNPIDIGRLSAEGKVHLSNLFELGEVFYFKLAKTSHHQLKSIVEIPRDDLGNILFSKDFTGIEDLIEYTKPYIFSRNDYYEINSSSFIPLFNSQPYYSKSNANLRYAVTEIRNEGVDSLETQYCVMDSCQDLNVSLTQSTKIIYKWEAQYRLEISTSHSVAGSIPRIRITNTDINESTILTGVGEYWITDGDKVELLSDKEGIDNLIVNGLSFKDSSGIPENKTLEVVTIDNVEYYTVILTEKMYAFHSGEVEWSYGTKIHEFENILGQPFTLDLATLYTGLVGSDASMKTRTQVSDMVLDAIMVQGAGHKPALFTADSDSTPDDSVMMNSLIYDSKDPSSDVTNFGRNKFIGKLYFTRPGRYRLEWLLGGDDFPIGSDGIQKLVIEVNVKWSDIADYHHVAETPDVSLENSLEDDFFFKGMRLAQKFVKADSGLVALNTQVDEISLSNEKAFSFPLWSELDKNSVYRSVLYFSKSLDPSVPAIGDISKEEVVIKVVETRHWSNTKGSYPLEEKEITIATEIRDSEHNISVGHNGYIMQTEALSNARYNPTTYKYARRDFCRQSRSTKHRGGD